VPTTAGDARPLDFDVQCEALLDVGPPIVSSVMGLYPPTFVARLKERGISWFANVSTVAEARAAEAAGADVIVAQGMEAGGHRGCFDASKAEVEMVGLFALIPAVVDAVRLPVVATGGIADARGVAAALVIGASAVQVGTGFLRCPEARLHPAWAEAIGRAPPEGTIVSRVFSGRAGRSLATAYARAATAADAPTPAPYPVQRGLTQAMREAALRAGATWTGCKPGPGNRPRWRGPSPPRRSCARSGRARAPSSGRDSRGAVGVRRPPPRAQVGDAAPAARTASRGRSAPRPTCQASEIRF
jgi:nitronate monooxygenase